MPIKEFSVVDLLTYFIPGSLFLFGLYIGGIFESLAPLITIENDTIQMSLLIIGSYIAGHIIHYPAVILGRLIIKLVGTPQLYLLDADQKKIFYVKRKLRKDFPKEYKKKLNEALSIFWDSKSQNEELQFNNNYYDQCEVLVEEYHPRAWGIHERFYTSSNLTRALIIPLIVIAIVILKTSLVLSISLFIGSLILGYRYFVLTVSAVKQIYNMFYLHFIKNEN